MQILKKFWNNFKTQPDIWFFYGFLITATLSIRKVLYFFSIKESFNEYSGVFLYLSDILLILTLASWTLIILRNKNYNLSIDKLKKGYILAPFLLIIWAFLSIIWSNNQQIALFRSIKLFEFFLLYLYIIFRLVKCFTPAQCSENVPPQKQINCSTPVEMFHVEHSTGRAWNNLFKIIIGLGVFQSIIAILQFILQKSLGLFWLKESIISPEILGVAKVVFSDDKFIRAYGLFPHPNILGGFLLFSIIITILHYKMFHVEQLSPRRKKWFCLVFFLQGMALFFSFSKAAIIGLAVSLAYLIFIIVPPAYRTGRRETIVLYLKKQAKWLFLGFLLALTFFFITKINLNSLFIQSLDERLLFLDVSHETILQHPIAGSGIGQFVLSMQGYSKQVLEFWQFQPVHNVFLLIWSESGVIGIILFLFFVFNLLLKKKLLFWNQENCSMWNNSWAVYFKAIFLGLIFIMFFDHYLWDIQQGQVLFWVTAGLLVASKFNIDKN